MTGCWLLWGGVVEVAPVGADQVEGADDWTEEACGLPGEGSGRQG